MADNGSSKPAIPAWQRATQKPMADQSAHSDQEEIVTAKAEDDASEPTEVEIPTPEDPTYGKDESEPTLSGSDPATQLEQMKTFLEDPEVRNASLEKKRAFFESKGIPKDLCDQVLREQATIQMSDFESFKQQQQEQVQAQPATISQQQKSSGPPIITYPEFLVEAHKPPPLITPTRILNTAYVASGIAALVYGASKYLVAPMSESLTEARHEFAAHSQSKVDDMNERLSKLVSKLPEFKKQEEHDTIEETDSETSDPTELYHRDMGTQTSPPPSPRTQSLSRTGAEAEKKKNPLDYHITGLGIIQSHLQDMVDRNGKVEVANKDRQTKVDDLKSYLDTLMYTSPGIYSWSQASDAELKGDGKEDAVEELKKEIRGVKGSLLSAKRFPGVAARAAAAGA